MKFNIVYIGSGISKRLLELFRASNLVDNVNYVDIGFFSPKDVRASDFRPNGFLNINYAPLAYFFDGVLNSAINSNLLISKSLDNNFPFILFYNTSNSSALSRFKNLRKVFVADKNYLKRPYYFSDAVSSSDFVVNLTDLDESSFSELLVGNSVGFDINNVFTPNKFIDDYCFVTEMDFSNKILVGAGEDLDILKVSRVAKSLPQYDFIQILASEDRHATFTSSVVTIDGDIGYTYLKNCKELLVTEEFFQSRSDIISSLGRSVKFLSPDMNELDIKNIILGRGGRIPQVSSLSLSSIEGKKMFGDIICETL